MPKFVWQLTARGHWAPQLFTGELPREMTQRENAARYAVHPLSPGALDAAMGMAEHFECSVLDYLAGEFPPPPPFTGKED